MKNLLLAAVALAVLASPAFAQDTKNKAKTEIFYAGYNGMVNSPVSGAYPQGVGSEKVSAGVHIAGYNQFRNDSVDGTYPQTVGRQKQSTREVAHDRAMFSFQDQFLPAE